MIAFGRDVRRGSDLPVAANARAPHPSDGAAPLGRIHAIERKPLLFWPQSADFQALSSGLSTVS